MVIVTTREAGRKIMTASLSAGGRFVNGMPTTSAWGWGYRTLQMEGICNLSTTPIMLDFIQM